MQQISSGTDLFVHHVPGRLRLRAPWLPTGAVEDVARAISGVTSAKTNPFTGSLTITYEPARIPLAGLWAALQASLGVPLATISCPPVGTRKAETAAGEDWGDRIADALVRKLAEWRVLSALAPRSLLDCARCGV
jgi:hypothetical protein